MIYEVEILNWEKYNSRNDQKKHSWYRAEAVEMYHPAIHKLSHPGYRFWSWLKASRCQQVSSTIVVDTDQVSSIIRVRADHVAITLGSLADHSVITFDHVATTKKGAALLKGLRGKSVKTCALRTNDTNDTDDTDVSTPVLPGDAIEVAPIKFPSEKTKTAQVWLSYSAAYESRYGEAPSSNGKNYGICKHFIGRIPAEDATAVAAFYVSHNDAFYVKNLHPLTLMLKDAEKLRTEWKVGRQMTGDTARKVESSQNNANAISDFLNNRPQDQR